MKNWKVGLLLLALTACFFSCETSEGRKVGVLQKVSHKTFPVSYYEIEIAYEGGQMVSDGKNSSYQNTQDFKIDQAGYDTLQNYVGDRVVFEYHDEGFSAFGSSKKLSFLQVKTDRGLNQQQANINVQQGYADSTLTVDSAKAKRLYDALLDHSKIN